MKNRLTTKKSNFRELLAYAGVYLSTLFVCAILFGILFNVFWGGGSLLSVDFLVSPTEDQSRTIILEKDVDYGFDFTVISDEKDTEYEINSLDTEVEIKDIEGHPFTVQSGMIVQKIDHVRLAEISDDNAQIEQDLRVPPRNLEVKIITQRGDGIFPLILTTLVAIVLSLLVALPLGIFAAIYLVEYEVPYGLNKYIHFAIDSLSGIPSIIFGLFGILFFSISLQLGKSLIAGILTVSIMLLPIIIKTVEEALEGVPQDFKEASFGLGANKIQTIYKVILPTATPGILVAIILAVGRIIGESAIFVFVVGTSAAFPSLMGNGSTLTAYAYNITRESSTNYTEAYAIGAVIIIIVLVLNLLTKLISKKMSRR